MDIILFIIQHIRHTNDETLQLTQSVVYNNDKRLQLPHQKHHTNGRNDHSMYSLCLVVRKVEAQNVYYSINYPKAKYIYFLSSLKQFHWVWSQLETSISGLCVECFSLLNWQIICRCTEEFPDCHHWQKPPPLPSPPKHQQQTMMHWKYIFYISGSTRCKLSFEIVTYFDKMKRMINRPQKERKEKRRKVKYT